MNNLTSLFKVLIKKTRCLFIFTYFKKIFLHLPLPFCDFASQYILGEAIFRICSSNTVKSSAHYLADLWTWFLYFFNLLAWLRRLLTAGNLLNKFQCKVLPRQKKYWGAPTCCAGHHRDSRQGLSGQHLNLAGVSQSKR